MRSTEEGRTAVPRGKAHVFLALALLQNLSRTWTSGGLARATGISNTTIRRQLKAWRTEGTVSLAAAVTTGPGSRNVRTYEVTPEGVSVLRKEVRENVFDGMCLVVAARLHLSIVKALGDVAQPDAPRESPAVKPDRHLTLVHTQRPDWAGSPGVQGSQ